MTERFVCVEQMKQVSEKSSVTQEQNFEINRTPLCGSLEEIAPITLEMVSKTYKESLWDYLVREYHYLSHRQMLGARLKYLVFAGGRPIAAIGWRSAALKIQARDYFIGWSEEQRKSHLKQIANNNRFLILPWVQVRYLASHILSKNVKVLSEDWYRVYGERLLLLETFVDPERFAGICYRAANWIYVGETKGYTKRGSTYQYHGVKKEVYVYVLDRNFRKILNCRRRPFPQSSLRMYLQGGKGAMILSHRNWDSEMVSLMDLDESDIEGLSDELVEFHDEFVDFLARKEQHLLGLAYLRGLLSDINRKTAEGIALEFLGSEDVRSTQSFMTSYRWDQEGMLGRYQTLLAQLMATEGGMIHVDSSEFPKKGKESVGVARQYCGAIGKVENCQSGVFVGYCSPKGYGLIDRRLYMPEEWFTDEYKDRRQKCRVPEELKFMTKLEIALKLIENVKGTQLFPAKWLGCDATFGSDHTFLTTVGKDFYYFANIRSNTYVWLKKPEVGVPPYSGKGRRPERVKVLEEEANPVSVSDIAHSAELKWRTFKLAEGAKGPIIADIARLRVIESRDGMPGKECWLFMRRSPDGEIKYALSNAPKGTPLEEMIRVSTMRWSIEQCFEDGKRYLGMDHYEHRSWPGWHRHITYVFLAQLFLLRLRYKFKKNSHLDPSTSEKIAGSCFGTARAQ